MSPSVHPSSCLPSILSVSSTSKVTRTPGKSYWRGKLSTNDLCVLNSWDQLSFILKILFLCFKTRYLNEVNYTEPSSSVSIPCRHGRYWRKLQSRILNIENNFFSPVPSNLASFWSKFFHSGRKSSRLMNRYDMRHIFQQSNFEFSWKKLLTYNNLVKASFKPKKSHLSIV